MEECFKARGRAGYLSINMCVYVYIYIYIYIYVERERSICLSIYLSIYLWRAASRRGRAGWLARAVGC